MDTKIDDKNKKNKNNYLCSARPCTCWDTLFQFVLYGSQYLYVQVDATMAAGVESYFPVGPLGARVCPALDA